MKLKYIITTLDVNDERIDMSFLFLLPLISRISINMIMITEETQSKIVKQGSHGGLT